MVIPLCTYLLVRRKILRLYKAVAIEGMCGNCCAGTVCELGIVISL